MLFENQSELITLGNGGDELCIYVVVLVLIAIFLYILLYLHKKQSRIATTMFCNYCGVQRQIISSCCGAPLRLKGLRHVCTKCKRTARGVCIVCRRPLVP